MRVGIVWLVIALAWPAAAMAQLVPPPQSAGWELPEPFRSAAAWVFSLQRELNAEMRQHLASIRDTGAWGPAFALIGAAFLYGVFHAAGPGHGKVVIGSWFATHRASVAQGLAACGLAALVQAGSAVLLVGIPAGLLAMAPRDIMAAGAWLEVFSYGVIAVLGGVLAWRALKGHTCSHGHSHSHSHSHEHGHGCCDGHHHHEHSGEDLSEDGASRREIYAMAAAVGFRPCSGAILVLLFTIANGLFWVGIAATLAMGVGVALTVSGIGLGAVGLNRLLDRGFIATNHTQTLRKVLGIGGASAIMLLGLILLAGSLIDGPQLTG